jgi:phasin family protein
MKTFEDMQKFGKDSLDASMKSFGACSKTAQTIAVEIADYSKKAFEDGAAAAEKLCSAKSIEKAIEVQSDYFKTAYESFVAESAKLGELYADWAQEAYKPFEACMGKAAAPMR